MKKLFIILPSLFVVGCSSPGTSQRVAFDSLATVGGGTAAYYASNKNPALTAAGVVGGFAISEFAQSIATVGRKKAYNSGLEEGKAIGQQQVLEGLWQQSNGLNTGTSKSQFQRKIVLPARIQNGVKYDAVEISEEDAQDVKLLIPSQKSGTIEYAPHYEKPVR